MDATPWPMASRQSMVDELAATLSGGGVRGVVLSGPAGIGKSVLAAQLVEHLSATPHRLVSVYANTSLSPIPLGALAAPFEALGVPLEVGADAVGPERVLDVERGLRRDGAAGLCIDDVAALDDVSLGIVANLMARRRVIVVCTARSGVELPEAIRAAIDSESLRTVDVAPLSASQTRGLIEAALGAPVDPATAHVLLRSSEGNPLLLRELVRAAAATSTFRPGPHGLRLVGPPPAGRLIDVLGARFATVSSAQRAVLELLAAAQPLPITHLDIDSVELLESGGLVVVEAAQVRLAHPLYDEIVRATTASLRWHARLVEAAAIMATLPGTGHLRAVTALCDAQAPVDGDDLVRAAREAYASLDLALAVRLADVALAREQRADALVVKGASLSQSGELAEAAEALEAALELAGDDDTLGRCAQAIGIHHAVRCNDARRAIELVESALQRCTDPHWRAFIEADLVKWNMMAGAGAGGFRSSADSTGVARVNELLIEAMVCAVGGDLDRATRCIDEGVPLAQQYRDVLGHASDLFELSRFLTVVFAGDLRGAEALVRDHLDSAHERSGEPEGMWHYCAAMISYHRGFAGRALEQSDAAVAALAWRDYTGLLPSAQALRASALGQLGRVGDAAAQLAEIDPSGVADPKVAVQISQAQLWIALADGQLDAGAHALENSARAAIETGHLYQGALGAYELVKVGRGVQAAAVLKAAADAQGDLVSGCIAHSEALANGDVDGLNDAAERLVRLGFELGAACALDQGAALVTGRARVEAARRMRRRADALGAGRDGFRSLTRSAHFVELTPREREVAVLAARPMTNREISEHLGTSTRTVENHLANAYRKLAVSNRSDLAAELVEAGLLAPPPPSD